MANDPSEIEKAVGTNDAMALMKSATAEELERLRVAEQVLGLARERKKNTSRWTLMSQTLVGVVAVAGMLVNAFQSYANKQQQQQQAKLDQERWNKEFLRAQRADKYRAFFETSVLATDPGNPDKRIVGYALLQEFVDDEDYNSKATLMLEESLAQELRTKKGAGLDEAHRNAVVAIVSALSESNDCHALERASRSIDRLAQHHAAEQDSEETSEIFRIYVRKLVGRASVTCKTLKDFVVVRRPLVEALVRFPELGGEGEKKLAGPAANARIAQLLSEVCEDEVSVTGVTECQAIFDHYATLCGEVTDAGHPDEVPACAQVKQAQTALAALAKPVAPPAPEP